MTSFATLTTRLYGRLGITTASAAEESLAEEALNAAIAKAAAEGAPELRQVYSGYTLESLSVTVTHTASTAVVTLNSVAGVYPGDIFTNGATGRSYIIRSVSGSTINLGIPVVTSMTGDALCTVTRRSFPLPTAGTVWEVRQVNSSPALIYDPLISAHVQFETGTPKYYTQGYATEGDVSYLSLFPAPSTSTQFIIVQTPGFAKDSDVYMSQALQNYVLAEAYKYRQLMTGGQGGAMEMAKDFLPLRTKGSASHGVQTKGGF